MSLYVVLVVGGIAVGFVLKMLVEACSKQPPIKNGVCVCGHNRNVHQDGHDRCRVSNGISEKFPDGSNCACDIYIEKTEAPKPPEDKVAKELERMIGL